MCVCVCKKHAKLFLLSWLPLFSPIFLYSQQALNCPDPPIYGNYLEGDEGENFQVKVYMNFIEYENYEWIDQQEADIRAKRAFDYLNGVFNEIGIFFTTPGNPCGENIAEVFSEIDTTYGVSEIRGLVPNSTHSDGIDLYFLDDTRLFGGSAFSIPSNFLLLQGEYDDGAATHWAGDTPVLIHEMGHCLGLMHPDRGGDCDELNSYGVCPNGTASGYCTGDHVSDTPPVNGTETSFNTVGVFATALPVANPNCATPEPCEPPCDEDDLAEAKDNFHQNKATWLEKKAAYPQITGEEEQEEALREIAGLRYHLNKDAKNIITHYRQDTLNHEPDSVLHWLALVETYPADYRLARHHFFTGKFYNFDHLWPNLAEQYGLDSTRLAEYNDLDEVFATLRPYLEGGGALNQLPKDTINSLLYWAGQCNEAGALARNLLLANGLRLEVKCTAAPPVERPAAPYGSQTTPASSAGGQGIRAYPNPTRDQLFLALPESAGQGQAVFYNLQGKVVQRLPLFGGLNRLPLPPALFRPGIYLLKAWQGGAAYQLKIAIH